MKTGNYLCFFLIFLLFTCNSKDAMMIYQPIRLSSPLTIDANWDKNPWLRAPEARLTHYMGEKPEHFPDTRVKLAWDDSAIYVIFRVKDKFVRSVHRNHQDPVYRDSCVEFFFIPGEETGMGYFNLEMNCGGTMLFHHQTAPRTGSVSIRNEQIEQVMVAATLPPIIDPEIEQDTTWVVEYRIPFSILGEYHDFEIPEKGMRWRANFYKCGDDTSHPHWLTWAPVDLPNPDFHQPEYFGWIEF